MILIAILTTLLCLQNLQEACSTKLLLEMDKTISIVDTETRIKDILVKDIPGLLSWDYHYDKGYLYYIVRRYNNIRWGDLKRLNIKDKSVVPLPFSSDDGELEVVVDFVRDELYVMTGKDAVVKSDLDGQNRREVLPFSDVKNHLGWSFADVKPLASALSIDPFEGYMFLTYNSTSPEDTDKKYVILRTDLNGKGMQMHRGYIYYKFSNTVLDLSTSWLYLVRNSELHYFHYDTRDEIGSFKVQWDNVVVTRLCDVFKQNFYMAYSVGTDIIVYEYPNAAGKKWDAVFNDRRNIAHFKSKYNAGDFCDTYNPRDGCVGVGVMVYDPRRQRRMIEGKFQCKRQDCSHSCEVRQDTGDTCTCPEQQFLKADQKTCEALSCRVPDPTNHRVFSRYPCSGGPECALGPGAPVAHAGLVTVTCDAGYYTVQGDSFSSDSTLTVCNYGTWFPRFPTCLTNLGSLVTLKHELLPGQFLCYSVGELCPPLTSLTVKFTCYQGPRLVSCDKPMLPGTVVEFSCKEYHDSNEKNHANGLTCNSSGQWSRPIPHCTPNCGKSNLNSNALTPAIVGDSFSEMGNFPWHTGLYHMKNNTWEAVCGATLVSPKAILTAAHCVTNPCDGCKATAMNPSDVMVALGKRYRSWGTTERSQVKKRIKEIRVHQDYVGSTVNFGQDIAILVMESAVEVNNYVMPACVDFSRKNVKRFNEDKTLQGYVAGWGNTEECSSFGNACGSISETLKYAKTTIIFFNECFTLSQSLSDKKLKSHSRLTSDKFCSGDGTESVVQKGDSGGGLTFVFDGLHHVFGVVSLKLKLEVGDRTFYSFGAFTNVQNYLDWIKLQFYEI